MLKEQINNNLKDAMRAKNELELSVLRMLMGAMKNKEITLRDGGKAELSDEQILEVIASEVKKRKDAIDAYEQGGRKELADKEKEEIKILGKYLPAQLADEEIETVVREIAAGGAADFGRTMGQAMAKLKGKASGDKVGAIVKKVLAEK